LAQDSGKEKLYYRIGIEPFKGKPNRFNLIWTIGPKIQLQGILKPFNLFPGL